MSIIPRAPIQCSKETLEASKAAAAAIREFRLEPADAVTAAGYALAAMIYGACEAEDVSPDDLLSTTYDLVRKASAVQLPS